MTYFICAAALMLPWIFIIAAGRKLGMGALLRNFIGVALGATCLAIFLILSPGQIDGVGPKKIRASSNGELPPPEANASHQSAMGSLPRREVPKIPQKNLEHEDIVRTALRSPEAAYQLSLELMECSDLDRLVEEHKGLASRLNEEQLASATAHLDALSTKCLPLLGMNERTAYDLVRHAASSGVLEAQLYFPAIAATYISSSEKNSLNADLVRQFKDDTVRFAREAASTGSPEALYHAYTVFSDGLFIEPSNRAARYYLSEYLKQKPNAAMHAELQRLASKPGSQESGTSSP